MLALTLFATLMAMTSQAAPLVERAAPAVPAYGSTVTLAGNNWYSGACVQDTWPHVVAEYFERSDSMTQDYCAAKCYGMQKKYMAVEYGSDCYCSNSLDTSAGGRSIASSSCDTACSGNSKQNCGGYWTMVVFQYAGTYPSAAASSSVAPSASASASKSVSVAASSSSSAAVSSSASASKSSAAASSAVVSSAAISSSSSAAKSSAAASSAVVSSAAASSSSSAPVVSASAAASSSSSSSVAKSSAAASSAPASSAPASSVAASSVAASSAPASSAPASSAAASSAPASSAAASSSSSSAAQSASSSAPASSAAAASSAAVSSSAPVSSAVASSVAVSSSAPASSAPASSVAPSSTSSAAPVVSSAPAIDPLAIPAPWVAAAVPVIAEATQGTGRALIGSSLASDDMTYTKCLNFCSTGGFALAGIEYGRECYCGNYLTNGASTSLPATATMNCAGSTLTATALCGGPNAITLFVLPSKITGLSSDLTTKVATLASGWSAASTSCIQEGSSGRALSATSFSADNMTATACVAYCDSNGYGYAGVEYGRECYCGNTLNSNVVSNQCNMPCAGDSTSICGGPNAISLYRNPSLPKVTTPVLPSGWSTPSSSCVQEVSGRALTGASLATDDMTVPKCLNYCSSKGFQYGAIEYGRECYCGSSLVNGASLSLTSGQCNVACAGDATTTCGGPNALQIYVNPTLAPTAAAPVSVNGFSNSGCIQEVAGRALTGASTTAKDMTVAQCTSYCQAQGFTMAGVEYGSECYCGNSLVNGASTTLTSGQCNMACVGDSSATCGGPNAINLYTVSA